MYARDCAAIAAHAAASPAGLCDVLEFTLCTIQMGLSTVKQQRRDIADNGASSAFLFGSKRDGWLYMQQHAVTLWGEAMSIRERGLDDASAIADAVQLFMQIPGLGLVKASFVAQMLGFNVACLDTHNLARHGIGSNRVKISAKLSAELKRKRVLDYIQLCHDLAGAGRCADFWWNSWCDYVAGNKANKLLDTGDVVSKYHYDAVTME